MLQHNKNKNSTRLRKTTCAYRKKYRKQRADKGETQTTKQGNAEQRKTVINDNCFSNVRNKCPLLVVVLVKTVTTVRVLLLLLVI